MKLNELFCALKEKWPEKMDISKAELSSPRGFLCWEQIELVEKISNSSESAGLFAAAIWPFHQALGEVSRELYAQGRMTVARDDVRIRDFEKYLLEALADDSWVLEREEYFNHN